MKKYIFILIIITGFAFTSCEKFLDRPSLTTMNDGNYWTSENNLRLFADGFYSNYFVGYNSTWGVDYAPLRGYYFSDDFTSSGKQAVLRHRLRNREQLILRQMVIGLQIMQVLLGTLHG